MLVAQSTVVAYVPALVPVPPVFIVAVPPPKQATFAVWAEPVYDRGELVMEAVGAIFSITKFPAESPVAAK